MFKAPSVDAMAGYEGGGTKGWGRNRGIWRPAGPEFTSCTCIFLESNKYFLKDVFHATDPERQLGYLLGLAKAARATSSAEVNGELCNVAAEAAWDWPAIHLSRALIPKRPKRQKFRLGEFRLKGLVLWEWAERMLGGRELLHTLTQLRFHQGPIFVFTVNLRTVEAKDGLTDESHEAVLMAYRELVNYGRPGVWDVSLSQRSLFVRCAVTCAVHYAEGDLFLLVVWDPESKEFKYPGGDVLHLADDGLPSAARREFFEDGALTLVRALRDSSSNMPIEIGGVDVQEMRPFGISEKDLAEPEPFNERSFVYYYDLGHINTARYQVIPYLFVKVTADFFRATFRASGATNGYLKEVDEAQFLTNKSNKALIRQYHLGEHHIPWLEHQKWGWAKSDVSGVPGEVFFVDELKDGDKKLSKLDKDLLEQIFKSGSWPEFARRFLR